MLDGLVLTELTQCAGLSPSIVDNILKHSHARNNRAVLFNLACAMIIHLIDHTLQEDGRLLCEVSKLHNKFAEKAVCVDSDSAQTASAQSAAVQAARAEHEIPGVLYSLTTNVVTADVVRVGEFLMKKIQELFATGPNGKHFISTVLFSCLLPTIGFHVLSRTGHTDIVHAFWFKHNAILHLTTHLKYQELSLFFAFFKGILPNAAQNELYNVKPGHMVMKLLSFSGHGKYTVNNWGFGYVHMDEALEMLVVRHLKSLSVNFLGHLENSAAWRMEVSMFRALIRYMTGAERVYGRKRSECDGGESGITLAQYDRNACQWRTVARLIHIMRDAGFLNARHRGLEWLTNVFCSLQKRMAIKTDQESILSIAERGALTAKLHASVLFPDFFGPLTQEDRDLHFDSKTFKRWTKSRAVIRPAKSMAKQGGVQFTADGEDDTIPYGHLARRTTEALQSARGRRQPFLRFYRIG